MKLHVKAALLSGFVLPGLGQLYKGARVKGGIMIALVNVFLLAALYLVMKGMGELLVTARLSGMAAARQVIDRLGQSSPGVRYLLAAFLALWVYSFVDALVKDEAIEAVKGELKQGKGN
jgi:TM2 domain-containing membrane protein YozV